MAESGNRDDWRRKRSLLALARDDAAAKRRGGSLLSMADENEQDAPRPAVEDAAARHRQARYRREAERAEQEAREAQPVAAGEALQTAAAEPGRKTSQRGSIFDRWRRGREEPEQAAAAAMPLPSPDVGDPRAIPEDARWKPLIDPMKIIGGITRSKLLIASTTLAGALIGVAIALSTPKMYQAWTEMIVDPRNLKLTDRELTEGGLPSDATLAIVENQMRVLTSGTVLTKVVDKLHLYDDPEFNGTAGGGFSLREAIRSLFSRNDAAGGDAAARRHTLATSHLYDALSIERGGKTFVVSIGAKTEDADKSALIANTMTEVFMQTYGELQSGSAGRATDELSGRLDEMRKAVEAAERKVETFKAENELIDPQGRLITDDEIQRVNDQLTAARARTLELNARAASTRNVGVDAVLSGALPEAINSPSITELRAQYAALTQEADRASVRLGPRHPERLALDAQLAGARERIATELRRVAASIQVELKRAVQTEQELSSRLAQLKVRQGSVASELVTLRELERDVTAKRAVYEQYLLRARETGEQRDINSANVSIISVATPPLESTGPSRSMIVLVGAFLGFAAGIGIGGLRGALESLRDTQRLRGKPSPRRVEPASAPLTVGPDRKLDPSHAAAPAPARGPASQSEQPPSAAAPYPPYPHPGYGLALSPASYGAPHPYPPAYPQQAPAAAYYPWPPVPPQVSQPVQPERLAPQNQIDEISESLREVRNELNQLRERRTRRYF
ncbi:GumC family protein [Aminobacter sp. HY435]|uniref:GumC family protein n=1 Tax=Aminobacter sp. HY435 TaxID=2970917 RepID=UPI0022B98E41|nr:GumC family protein [Aminobacter sp. HY435]